MMGKMEVGIVELEEILRKYLKGTGFGVSNVTITHFTANVEDHQVRKVKKNKLLPGDTFRIEIEVK